MSHPSSPSQPTDERSRPPDEKTRLVRTACLPANGSYNRCVADVISEVAKGTVLLLRLTATVTVTVIRLQLKTEYYSPAAS